MLDKFESLVRESVAARKPRRFPATMLGAYRAGKNCALHGADGENCHISLFGTTVLTRAWERGKRDGEKTQPTNEEDVPNAR